MNFGTPGNHSGVYSEGCMCVCVRVWLQAWMYVGYHMPLLRIQVLEPIEILFLFRVFCRVVGPGCMVMVEV